MHIPVWHDDQQGIARLSTTREQLYENASKTITAAREATRLLMREALIAVPPAHG